MLSYNLKEFGENLKEIRKKQNLTQKDINEKVSINIETLRKIENGLVVPKQETLDLLSSALNIDISALFLNYRMNDYNELEEIKKNLDWCLDEGNYTALNEILIELESIDLTNTIDYFRKEILQLICMIKGSIMHFEKRDYNASIAHYMDALFYIDPQFNLLQYKNYNYSELELRILMNIGMRQYSMENFQKALDILQFCLDYFNNHFLSSSSSLLSKIHYNISFIFHRIDDHKKALEHANLGIQYTLKTQSIVFLAHLYYRKGIAEFHLENPDYLQSLHLTKDLLLVSNHTHILALITESCKKYYGIII